MARFYKSLSETRFPFLAKTGSEKVTLAGARGYFAKNKVLGFSTFALGLMKYQHFQLGVFLGGSIYDAFSKVENIEIRQ